MPPSCAARATSSSTASTIARRRSTSSPSPRNTSSSPASRPARCSSPRSPSRRSNGRVTGIADGPLHQPSRGRRRGRDLRGRCQDRRAQARRSRCIARRPAPTASGGRSSAAPTPAYEFVLRMAGQPVTHTYRSPFLRSSDVVHLRPEPFAKADEGAAAVVVMTRPRGYFGVGRDKFSLDGKMPPGITEGVPGVVGRSAGLRGRPAHGGRSVQQRDHRHPHLAGQGQPHRGGGVPELTIAPHLSMGAAAAVVGGGGVIGDNRDRCCP